MLREKQQQKARHPTCTTRNNWTRIEMEKNEKIEMKRNEKNNNSINSRRSASDNEQMAVMKDDGNWSWVKCEVAWMRWEVK